MEVCDYLYANTTFILHTLRTANHFLQNLHLRTLRSIRIISIHWSIGIDEVDEEYGKLRTTPWNEWVALIHCLSSADGLNSLRIRIFGRHRCVQEKALVEPLSVLQVPNFTIHLPWPIGYLNEHVFNSDTKGVFEIQRPTLGGALAGDQPYPNKKKKGFTFRA